MKPESTSRSALIPALLVLPVLTGAVFALFGTPSGTGTSVMEIIVLPVENPATAPQSELVEPNE